MHPAPGPVHTGAAPARVPLLHRLFVDRSAKHFDAILDYLRNGTFLTDGLSARERAEIRQEADFYQLHGLLRSLEGLPFLWERPCGSTASARG
eukprot:gene7103-8991_t